MDPRELTGAAWSRNVVRMRALIREGADVNHADSAGWTALFCAARAGSMECVQVLFGGTLLLLLVAQ